MEDMLKLISTLYRKTQMYLREELKSISLSRGQAMFIMCLCDHKTLTQNKLCELLDMDKSTVAKTLGKLEEQGFITRRINQEDSRSLDVSPTQKAWEIYPKAQEIGLQWSHEITKNLSDIERSIFLELMHKVTACATEYFE